MKAKLQMGMIVFALTGASFLASCSSHITKEQLAEMRSLRESERSLKSQIEAKNDEKRRLQGEVDQPQREVDNCNSKKQFVSSKLQQWPNVWPANLFPEN